jgi:hypothetical protein
MRICGSYTHILLVCLMVLGWNSELKARSTLFGAYTSCSLLRSDLMVAAVEIKDLKHKLDHSSRYTVLSHPYEACVSLKG